MDKVKPVTREDVIGIVGPLAKDRIAAIIATGATPEELTEAFLRLSAEDDMGGVLSHPVSGVIGELVEILESDEPYPEEERA
jgi:hypothetical protein